MLAEFTSIESVSKSPTEGTYIGSDSVPFPQAHSSDSMTLMRSSYLFSRFIAELDFCARYSHWCHIWNKSLFILKPAYSELPPNMLVNCFHKPAAEKRCCKKQNSLRKIPAPSLYIKRLSFLGAFWGKKRIVHPFEARSVIDCNNQIFIQCYHTCHLLYTSCPTLPCLLQRNLSCLTRPMALQCLRP